MTRDRQRKVPKRGSSLGDALSSDVRGDLYRLRDTLRQQARDTIAGQLAEPRPPWPRRKRSRTLRRASGGPEAPRHTSHTESQVSGVASAPTAYRRRKVTRLPPIPTFEYWPFPSEAVVREGPPRLISDVDRRRFETHLRADVAPSEPGAEELFIIVGLDFGTSSTKVIVRLPFEAGEPTIAIPAPAPCRSGDDPYLWQTVLWLRSDGAFVPWPEPGAGVLGTLKQGLIWGRAETAIPTSGTLQITRSDAGVAYLAFVIRYVKGWLRLNRSNHFRGRRPVWFVNVGIPTASYDDVRIFKSYRQIAAAALQLAKIDASVTVESVRLFLGDSHVVGAADSDAAAEELGVAVFPEAAAEMTGFTKSSRNAPGLYLLVDVGAMTLDACMFGLNRDASQANRYAFWAADVRPLGVDAFHWFLAEGKKESEFIDQCRRMVNSVVLYTKRHRDPRAEAWRPGNDVPVFSRAVAPRTACIRMSWISSGRGSSVMSATMAFGASSCRCLAPSTFPSPLQTLAGWRSPGA